LFSDLITYEIGSVSNLQIEQRILKPSFVKIFDCLKDTADMKTRENVNYTIKNYLLHNPKVSFYWANTLAETLVSELKCKNGTIVLAEEIFYIAKMARCWGAGQFYLE
jgi:hypothetical protein